MKGEHDRHGNLLWFTRVSGDAMPLPHTDARGMAYACRCFALMALHPTHQLSPIEGRLVGLPALRERVCSSGVAPGPLRREVWKFLVGLYPPCSTERERRDLMLRLRADYQV